MNKKEISVRKIPLEVLFGNPVKSNPQISPDGKKLAFMAPFNNTLTIWIQTMGSEDERIITEQEHSGISDYFWAFDNRHILFLMDDEGKENTNLYIIDIETGHIKNLTPYEDVQVRIIACDRHFPCEIIIAMNKEDHSVHDLYLLNITSGHIKFLLKNPGNIKTWIKDNNFNIRCAITVLPDGTSNLLIKKDEHSEWDICLTWDMEDSISGKAEGFTEEGRSMYLLDSRNSTFTNLVKLDIGTGKTEIIASHPSSDINEVLINPVTHEVEAYSVYRFRKEWFPLDETMKSHMEHISKLDEGDVFICNRDNQDRNWIIGFAKDCGPVSYYHYNLPLKKGTFLFYNNPCLNDYKLCTMEEVAFTARDGLKINGYITYPHGKERKNLPLVLTVHGGPWHRDLWYYNPVVQWLSNRGYACLQINYRGSTGYGKDFLNAGNREWGRNMQNDLTDGIKWAMKEGIAGKAAIMGGSYGGYASLCGAAFTPDLFCCAVSVNGPSNLIRVIKNMPPYWSQDLKSIFLKRVGDPDREEDFLMERSPLFKADKIKCPLLIACGANDPRVKPSESEQIVEVLKKKSIEHKYIVFPDEGHIIRKAVNKFKLYSEIEKFLKKYMGER